MKREKEIKEFIEELEKLWLKYPNFKFGQLLCNTIIFDQTILFEYNDEEMLNKIKENNK